MAAPYNLKSGVSTPADLEQKVFAAGGTLTLDPEIHDGGIILLDTATGSVVTLPTSTGGDAVYTFIVSVLASSNSHKIQVTTTDVMAGLIHLVDTDTAGTTTGFATGATSDTITLNRSTTGSVTIGEWIEVRDTLSGTWTVRGVLSNTGNGATPFSAAVGA